MVTIPVIRLSGGQPNTNPKFALGGIMSDTVVVDNILENAFDNVTRAEALAGKTEYRCFYIYNPGPDPVNGCTIEITTNPALTRVSAGLDSTAGKGNGSTSGVAQAITTEDITPSNIKFWGEDSLDSDGPYNKVILPIGFLGVGQAVPFWLKRTTEQGAQQVVSVGFGINYDNLGGSLTEEAIDGGAIGEVLNVVATTSGTFKIGTAIIGFSDMG